MEKEILNKLFYNIRNRKLVMRAGNAKIEKLLFERFGLKASFYVSRSPSRIDNMTVFSDEILKGKMNEYYLLLPDLKYNEADERRYESWGYKNIEDVMWLVPSNRRIAVNEKYYHAGWHDLYGNTIETKSNAHIEFQGSDSKIIIGKNVKMPDSYLCLGNKVKIVIEDNVDLSRIAIVIKEGGSCIIKSNVRLGDMRIVIGVDSKLEIGEYSSFGQGCRIRTGRNQFIKIGKDCMFSWDVTLLGHDGHMIYDVETGKCMNNTNGQIRTSITIDDHVWVGGEVKILPNSHIGKLELFIFPTNQAKTPNFSLVQ